MEEAAIAANSENEVLKCVGSKHSLVLFWTRSNYRGGYYERAMEPNRYLIIGCDDDARKNLLRYRSHFLGHTFRWSCSDCHGVIERVLKNNSPEMSPNISFYSEDEYPHLHFALSCGILSSFCFPFYGSNRRCVMEIVSTSNQDVETLMKFCQSIKGFHWFWSFRDIKFHKYTQPVPEIDHLLEVVSQTFQLPLAQYWNSGRWIPCLVRQFSYPVSENLAPWSQFKHVCFHKLLDIAQGPLSSS
ncbi:protein NLP6-like isoform X3 [Apium graveolens]